MTDPKPMSQVVRTEQTREKYTIGPTVYVGDTYYTTCDSDGFHRDHYRTNGAVFGISCRCTEWSGTCPTKRTKP